MAVARALRLEPLQDQPFRVVQKALVVGGGVAGMTAALNLADQGFETILIERTGRLGGQALRLHQTLEQGKIGDFLTSLTERAANHPGLRLFLETELIETKGHVGKFTSILRRKEEKFSIDHGAIIVATGGSEYKPEGFLYGRHRGVLTQLEFQEKLFSEPDNIRKAGQVAMIQCVGSRDEDHPYCSRVCCSTAVANALKIKEVSPGTEVVILYRDMRTYGQKELFYKKAREAGVRFIRFEPEAAPEVGEDQGKLILKVFDQNLKRLVRIKPDYLVLSAAIRPGSGTRTVGNILKLPLDADGFFLEAHIKLRPLDFANAGLFLCGLGHGPKSLEESILQAKGAAARAATLLAQQQIQVAGKVARVDEELCIACLTCLRVCPFSVPRLNERHFAQMDAAACQGCGNCASACPQGAIQVGHSKDDQYLALLEAC
jgi:heterodisulfide reductase subunit A-like polyferredoxin